MADLFNDQCGPEIGPPGSLATTCADLHASANTATPSLPDAMAPVLGHDISTSIARYEAVFGDRTIKLYARAGAANAITAASVTFNGYTGSDPYANYTLTWTSASDQILI